MNRRDGVLTSLETLDISNTCITDEWSSALKDASSNIEIVIEKGSEISSSMKTTDANTTTKNLFDTSHSSLFHNDNRQHSAVELEKLIKRAISDRTVELEERLERQEQVINSLKQNLESSITSRELNATVQSLRVRLEQMEMVVFQSAPGSFHVGSPVPKAEIEKLLNDTSDRVLALEKHVLEESSQQLKLLETLVQRESRNWNYDNFNAVPDRTRRSQGTTSDRGQMYARKQGE